MTRQHRASHRALIPRGGHDNGLAARRVVEGRLERAFASWQGLENGAAQVNHARARVHAVDDGVGERFGGCGWHLRAVVRRVGKDRAQQQRATGADGGSRGTAPARQHAGDERRMRAGGTVQSSADRWKLTGEFTDRRADEIRMGY